MVSTPGLLGALLSVAVGAGDGTPAPPAVPPTLPAAPPALKAWGGDPNNVGEAQKAFYRRAKFNGAARSGEYAPDWETSEVA